MSIDSSATIYRTLRVPTQDTAECDAQTAAIQAINNTITGLIRITATPDDDQIIVDVQSQGFYPISAVIPQIQAILGNVNMHYETTVHETEAEAGVSRENVQEPAAA